MKQESIREEIVHKRIELSEFEVDEALLEYIQKRTDLKELKEKGFVSSTNRVKYLLGFENMVTGAIVSVRYVNSGQYKDVPIKKNESGINDSDLINAFRFSLTEFKNGTVEIFQLPSDSRDMEIKLHTLNALIALKRDQIISVVMSNKNIRFYMIVDLVKAEDEYAEQDKEMGFPSKTLIEIRGNIYDNLNKLIKEVQE